MAIRLGPKGLSGGLKRILNLLVEEISLVDRAATRRKFVLIKRDAQDKPFEVSDGKTRRTNFMGFEEIKNLKVGETLEMERTEELGLPPDIERSLKSIIGEATKVLGYKYKTKIKYEKPGGDEQDKNREEAENERKNAKQKDKEEEPEEEDDDEDEDKKKKMKKATPPPKDKEIENAEVSKELEKDLKDILSELEKAEIADREEIQGRVDEVLEKMKSNAGGED